MSNSLGKFMNATIHNKYRYVLCYWLLLNADALKAKLCIIISFNQYAAVVPRLSYYTISSVV